MTHEVLRRVIDVMSLDASRDGVGRMKWRLTLLPQRCLLYILLYVYMYSCMYSRDGMYMLLGIGGYPVSCNQFSVVVFCIVYV